ncbi:translation initiation factor IF-2 [Candidatus Acetothermia bacterium]|nr:translation initiation factor IF-2 [Candidatus Acetothermia bacterium]MBI3643251.1 translation initiation factor IF-2 [Candidatus Acetothermia bacterium]
MAKKRVFEVAKEIGIAVKDLLVSLKNLGIEKSGNFSSLEDDEVAIVLKHFQKGQTPAPAKAAKSHSKTASVEKAKPAQTDKSKAAPATTQSRTAVAEPSPKKVAVQERSAPSTKAAPAVNATSAPVAEMPVEVREERPAAPAKRPEKPKHGVPRPPIVAVLGHVDHGKTSLLDKIRSANVAGGEAGGITQAIGAYQVDHQGKKITFIDTPGHRAFTGMRARGAQVTDIVILVVAADDGIMEQTVEAISHAKAAQVPIIVAINKIDKPGADLMRVKQQLTERELMPEEWGGSTITVGVSALTGEGIPELLEMILLVAELEELKADPSIRAEGVVIESYLDSSRGPVATAIIKNGTLHDRDIVVAGSAHGRIRALLDDRGRRLTEAPPGSPVLMMGLSDVPAVGVSLEAYDNPGAARKTADTRKDEERKARRPKARLTWDELMAHAEQKGVLKVILKADSVGSLEALQHEVQRLDTDEISLELLLSGVGNVGESDVLLAASSAEDDVIIFGFRVPIEAQARELADREQVTVRTYDIIYELIDDLKKAHRNLMAPRYEEVALGVVEVRNTFKIPRVGTVAGCYVRDGIVRRNSQVRVNRNNQKVFEGRIETLRRFEEDAKEVGKDKECGIKIEGYDDVRVGDVLEIFTLKEVERF